MLMSLKEAHNKFVEENPDKVRLSKFCELRPDKVRLFDHILHNVCVCFYHEDVRILLVALKKKHTMLSTEFKSFINQVNCDSSSKDCMSFKCSKCKDLIDTFTPSNPAEIMKYQQWQTDDKMEKVDIIATVSDAFVELKSQL